jgi:hypothetical protein
MEDLLLKIRNAIDFLKDGQSFTVNGLRLTTEKQTIIVVGWSEYIHFENLTRYQSIKELEEIKLLFHKMIQISLELKEFVKNKNVSYKLWYDDSGKASIPICAEINGIFIWETEIKNP